MRIYLILILLRVSAGKITYQVNRPRITQQLSLDIQNLTNRQNEFQKVYSVKENEIRTVYQQSLFFICGPPNLSFLQSHFRGGYR